MSGIDRIARVAVASLLAFGFIALTLLIGGLVVDIWRRVGPIPVGLGFLVFGVLVGFIYRELGND